MVTIPKDKLDKLRSLVEQTRDLELMKNDLEERLKTTNATLQELYYESLPRTMDEANVPSIEVGAEGNRPAFSCKCVPYFHANIPTSWPSIKREAAFKWLDDNGHGDLIKTEVTITFPRETRDMALLVIDELKKTFALEPEKKETVPWATLTSWLKELVEERGEMPPLDVIGGAVGRIVKPKLKK